MKTVGGKPVIDVTIRRGVKFHNGDPLTSADFEFAYQKLRDPKVSRWSHNQAAVERFEIVDDLRFRLHFKEGDGSYVANQLQLWAVPKAYYEKVGEAGFAQAPVGTGPWKFVSRVVKDELRLEAFDGYWNTAHRPKVKNLTIKIIPEDLTRVAAFKTGAVDWIDAVPLSMVTEFRKLPGVKTLSVVSGNNLYLDFNTHQPNSPFRDLRVRRAVAHAIDVDAIIKSVLFGQGQRYVQVGEGGRLRPGAEGDSVRPEEGTSCFARPATRAVWTCLATTSRRRANRTSRRSARRCSPISVRSASAARSRGSSTARGSTSGGVAETRRPRWTG